METRANKLPLAGDVVDGRRVLSEIPNQSSIASSLGRYEIVPGVRELSMDLFTYTPPYSVSEFKRVEELAAAIQTSQTISPLIVVEDAEGFYVLEGGHRFDALGMLGAQAFPALVVKDLDSLTV